MTCALNFQSHLPNILLSHALAHGNFRINRLPSKILSYKSPFALLYNALPDYTSKKVFGCLVCASSSENNRIKLDPRFRECVYLGYKLSVKGHILYDLKNK